jgi:acetyl esterase/lipase
MKFRFLFVVLMHFFSASFSQETIPLYDNTIINSIPSADEEVTTEEGGITRVAKITKPTLSIYIPATPAPGGISVIVCPGGGYSINAIEHEGTDIAKKLNEAGITAFVLKYRLPDKKTMKDPSIGPLQDVQQAIRIVRSRAKEWKIAPDRIGVLGFSAGGHLASSAGTHFKLSVIENPGNISLRPDFMVLIYPVISFMEGVGHMGSRNRMLGDNAKEDQVKLFSNELQVTSDTPPAFLVHASDDNSVIPDNSILFYQALLKNKIPCELHIYQRGGHGFGLNNPTTRDQWFDRCMAWLSANNWLK